MPINCVEITSESRYLAMDTIKGVESMTVKMIQQTKEITEAAAKPDSKEAISLLEIKEARSKEEVIRNKERVKSAVAEARDVIRDGGVNIWLA